ncbi:MAG: RsmB/NOP family class I SAM-dependent RNA methyltransferase [Candidatus Omnitrophica bacterium]|nr:RsmB/NOP family class I SAM-dependent RNA methyltransferase [Candidatus Omnitrophota bacterium]
MKTTESLPSLFIERLRAIIPAGLWDSVHATFSCPRPVSFRVNTLKADTASVRRALEKERFELRAVPWYPDAFFLEGGDKRALQETTLYRDGVLYIQSVSSMFPPLLLDPRENERVLDIAAAPGSKTTQIACLMKGTGEVVANDKSRGRFFKLKANVAQQGVPNVTLSCRDGRLFGKDSPGSFDKVLVDAPCSSEGRFHVDEPVSWRYWKKAKIKEMVCRQKPLLYSGIHALRPDGRLVYATCTFAPEENEAVVDWVLKKCDGSITVEEIAAPFPNHMPGLTSWQGKKFDLRLTQALRVLPSAEMEAFFVCVIRKHDTGTGRTPVKNSNLQITNSK